MKDLQFKQLLSIMSALADKEAEILLGGLSARLGKISLVQIFRWDGN